MLKKFYFNISLSFSLKISHFFHVLCNKRITIFLVSVESFVSKIIRYVSASNFFHIDRDRIRKLVLSSLPSRNPKPLDGVARKSNELEPSIICAALEGKPSLNTPPKWTIENSLGLYRPSCAFARVYMHARADKRSARRVRETTAHADAVTVKLTNFSRWTH